MRAFCGVEKCADGLDSVVVERGWWEGKGRGMNE